MALLYGPDNLPLKTTTAEHFATRENVGMLPVIFGMLPDPDEVLRKAGKGPGELRKIDGDGHLFSVWETRTAGLGGAIWNLIPGGDSPKDKKAYDFCKEILDRLDVSGIATESLEAVAYGMAPLEILWISDGKYWSLENIVGKPAEWFAFDDEANLVLRRGFDTEPVPPNRFLLVRNKATFLNPYGVKAFSRCFWPVTFKHAGVKWYAEFIEKLGGAFIFGEYAKGSPKPYQDQLFNALVKLASNSVGILPEGGKITIHESKSKGASNALHKSFLQFCDTTVSKVILGQTLTTEVGDKGTYAAAQVHDKALRKNNFTFLRSDFSHIQGA